MKNSTVPRADCYDQAPLNFPLSGRCLSLFCHLCYNYLSLDWLGRRYLQKISNQRRRRNNENNTKVHWLGMPGSADRCKRRTRGHGC